MVLAFRLGLAVMGLAMLVAGLRDLRAFRANRSNPSWHTREGRVKLWRLRVGAVMLVALVVGCVLVLTADSIRIVNLVIAGLAALVLCYLALSFAEGMAKAADEG